MDHLTADCNKSRDSPAKCALCSGDNTANYKGYPGTKRRNRSTIRNTHSVQKKTNYKHATSFKPSLPKVPDVQSKSRTRSYAEAVSNNNHTFLNSHTYEKSFTKFISYLSTLINLQITLLTVVINQLLIP
uniref:Uncharacterized protein n=1 Tax=Sipha flava TaxID=143950 RepID=A0A2S2Q6J7_9HEMI